MFVWTNLKTIYSFLCQSLLLKVEEPTRHAKVSKNVNFSNVNNEGCSEE